MINFVLLFSSVCKKIEIVCSDNYRFYQNRQKRHVIKKLPMGNNAISVGKI